MPTVLAPIPKPAPVKVEVREITLTDRLTALADNLWQHARVVIGR